MPAGSGNTAPTLTSITIFFFCWALFTFALRLYVKLPKRELWAVDDTVVALALLAALANLIATTHAVNHGYGAPWSALANLAVVEKVRHRSTIVRHGLDLTHYLQALYAAQLLYVVSMGGKEDLIDSWHQPC
ncbi:hypothetical protein LTR78_008929 [Recurvomyces mirabilis]|uniref:Uncharacterized protein n=1 Tax=Recurvomyces mirabilis TaxID=574656 RepID=A0AAE0TP34_9PEZI|nr:hypothetical protein LTR78_008929 [Recurvomyces mirabilis]KAK5159730.1 hypothetical protein LTS14_001835 [Recurvomyces mirabilis]